MVTMPERIGQSNFMNCLMLIANATNTSEITG